MDSNDCCPPSRVCIPVSDEDDIHADTVSLEKYRKEITALQAKLRLLEHDNSGLKSTLEDTEKLLKATQAELGKAVVANVMQVSLIILFSLLLELFFSRQTMLRRLK